MKTTLTLITLLFIGASFAQEKDSTFTEIDKAIEDPLKVKELYFCNNEGEKLPEDVAQMTNIELLCISGMGLTEFPEVIFSLPNLKELYMGDNLGLKGLPNNLSSLKNLTTLWLSGSAANTPCGYQGIGITSLPKVLVKCTKLTDLDLRGNVLTDCTLEDIMELVTSLDHQLTIQFDTNTFPNKDANKFMKKIAGSWKTKMLKGNCKTYEAKIKPSDF